MRSLQLGAAPLFRKAGTEVMSYTESKLTGVDIFDTFTLVTTNQGYWGRGSQSEANSSDEKTDPLKIALDNANALSPKTGKVKRGVTAWVSIIIVTTGDKLTEEEIESDRSGVYPADAKAGDYLKPYVGGYGNTIWRGTKVTEFTLKG